MLEGGLSTKPLSNFGRNEYEARANDRSYRLGHGHGRPLIVNDVGGAGRRRKGESGKWKAGEEHVVLDIVWEWHVAVVVMVVTTMMNKSYECV